MSGQQLRAFGNALRSLRDRGGPCEHEYPSLMTAISDLHSALNRKEFTQSEVAAMLSTCPEIFTQETMQGLAFKKPYGYAGDFEMIEKIYVEHTSVNPALEKWDRFFHSLHAPKAVRNRKTYFHSILDDFADREVSVLKLGVGPGRSMYEWLERNPDAGIHIECVDVDQKAIAYATALNGKHSAKVTFHHQNVFKFVPPLDAKFDLIWAAGLFDYFDDAAFVSIGKRFLGYLGERGKLVIGNFATGNPTRPYMELFGEWYLHHRTRDDLMRLALDMGVGPSSATVDSEEEGVNLFLHMTA